MNKIYFLLSVFMIAILNSCSKDENAGLPSLESGAVGNITKDASTGSNFDPDALDEMNIKFDVEIVTDGLLKSAEVSVMYNDDVKKSGIYEIVTSKVVKVNVTKDKILAAIDGLTESDFGKGDKFSFFVSKIVLEDGRVFEDLIIETQEKDESGESIYLKPTNLSDDFTLASPVFNTQINYYVACEFNPLLSIGEYHVVSDTWGAEGDVEIIGDPDDPYTVYIVGMTEMEGLTTGNGNKMKITIDPISFSATGPKVVSADNLSEWGLPTYTNYYYEPVDGLFLSCDGTYILTLKIGVDLGGFGNFIFTYTRK